MMELEAMRFEERIFCGNLEMGGQAYIRRLGIGVADILDALAGGSSWRRLLNTHAGLEPQDIGACLAYAAARERGLSKKRAANRAGRSKGLSSSGFRVAQS